MTSTSAALLVTGGAGFIGSAFVRQWLAEEQSLVVNLDKLTYAGHRASLMECDGHPRHELVVGDICDPCLARDLLERYRPASIVHLAAESHVDRSIDGPPVFVKTNVEGTCNLLEAARQYWMSLPAASRERFRFLHVSTDEVFGDAGVSGVFRETTAYAPNSPYAASKAAADHFARAYHRTYGLPVVITNSSNNYGPCQLPEKLIPRMLLCALQGCPLPVYGDGAQVRDWLHVDDHVRALRSALARGRTGQTYLVSGGAPRTNLDVVTRICDLVDTLRPGLAHAPCRELITHVPDRPGHDRRYAVDDAKLRSQLDWKPRHDFDSGLRQTVSWYLEHPEWVQAVSSAFNLSQRQGLGESAEERRS